MSSSSSPASSSPSCSSSLLRPASRSRASSTSVRPPLSLSSLAPRARAESVSEATLSTSCAHSAASSSASSSTPSTPVDADEDKQLPRTSIMFPVLVSRAFQLVRSLRRKPARKDATLFTISSPRSSTDTDYILPLSASPSKASFDDIPAALRSPSVHTPVLIVLILFPLTTTITLFTLSTLPINAAWPRNLSDLAQLGRDLNTYALSGFLPTLHVLAVLAVSAVWKHAWSIPGSVLWNVLAGALFHPLLATLFMTALTTIGSIFSTLLAAPLAPILTRLFPKPIELTRSVLEGTTASSVPAEPMDETKYAAPSTATASGSTPAWVRLSVLRLIGIVPWSGLNIACGLTGVSLRDCAAGAFIGTLPWTAVTCQIGDILHTVGVVSTGSDSVSSSVVSGVSKTATLSSVLASPQIIMELAFLSVLSLAPILARGHLRRLISPRQDDAVVDMESTSDDDNVRDGELSEKPRQRKRHLRHWSRLSLSNLFEKPASAGR